MGKIVMPLLCGIIATTMKMDVGWENCHTNLSCSSIVVIWLSRARARSAAAGLLVIVERDIICIFSPNGGDFSPAFPFRACHLSGMHNFVPFFFISVLQFQLNFFKQYARRRGICSFKMAHCTDIIKVFVSIFGCFFLAKANPSFVVPYSGHTELVFHAEHVGNVLWPSIAFRQWLGSEYPQITTQEKKTAAKDFSTYLLIWELLANGPNFSLGHSEWELG
jgi:hypothetical protein